MKKIILIFFLGFIFSKNLSSQINSINNTDDAQLLESYFSPLSRKTFGSGLNNGWYNTQNLINLWDLILHLL